MTDFVFKKKNVPFDNEKCTTYYVCFLQNKFDFELKNYTILFLTYQMMDISTKSIIVFIYKDSIT